MGLPTLAGYRSGVSGPVHPGNVSGSWDPTKPSVHGRELIIVTYPHESAGFAMWALGMAYFARRLVENYTTPRFLRSLILVVETDPAMSALAKR
jgi:hypothetical protein